VSAAIITALSATAFVVVAALATWARAAAGASNRSGHVPWGTLAVNLGGSFAGGVAAGWLAGGDATVMVLVVVAGLGSLTTFSGFARELLAFGDAGQWTLATVYLMAGSMGGVGLAATGLALSGAWPAVG
jgi:fluoride ion exporter CrcB/FEX